MAKPLKTVLYQYKSILHETVHFRGKFVLILSVGA